MSYKGFSHTLLLPLVAVLLVAIIGGVIATRSSSAATIATGTVDSKKVGKECYRKPHSIWKKAGNGKMNCVCVSGYVVNSNKNCVKKGSACGTKKVWASNGKCVKIGDICKRSYADPNSKDPYDYYTWSSKGTCSVGHYAR